MITTRPHGRPNGGLLARIQRRLTPRWQTVAQIAGDDMVGDVSRALSTLERDGLAEREGQRWRAPQPPEQAPTPERIATLAEVVNAPSGGVPAAVAAIESPPAPAPAPPVDLPAAVQEAARRREWWTRTDLATSVEIRTGAGRGSIEVEIARQLDDGRLQTEARGIRIRVPPELPPEPEPAPAEQPPAPSVPTEAALVAWRAERGLSQRELATLMVAADGAGGRVGSVQSLLSAVEGGSRLPPPRWATALARVIADSSPPSPEPGSQTLVPQAPASGGVQVDDGLATPTRPLIGGQLRGEPGNLAEEDALLAQAAHVERCDGCGGRRDDFYVVPMADGGHALLCGCGIVIAARPEGPAVDAAIAQERRNPAAALRDLAEYRGRRIEELEAERQELEETVQQLEAELRVIRSQRVAVDDGPRQELAQIRALVGTEHPTPIAVALLVGEARALRGRP